MNIYDVIIRPVITEKATTLRELNNQYQFEVQPQATKVDVKRAVEEIFKVTVMNVRTTKIHGKPKRNPRARKPTPTSNWKRAYVTLKKGDKIESFEGA